MIIQVLLLIFLFGKKNLKNLQVTLIDNETIFTVID